MPSFQVISILCSNNPYINLIPLYRFYEIELFIRQFFIGKSSNQRDATMQTRQKKILS